MHRFAAIHNAADRQTNIQSDENSIGGLKIVSLYDRPMLLVAGYDIASLYLVPVGCTLNFEILEKAYDFLVE